MLPGRAWRIACVCWLAAGGMALASAAELPDVPTPYVPSTQLNVDEMLRLAGVRPTDVVYDLGSGDGRIVIAAARDYGARGVGIELDADLVARSRASAAAAGVGDRASFRQGDVLTADVRDATVVTLYLLTSLVEKLRPRLLAELKPGTRIVAHEYGFRDWTPDRKLLISKNFYLYTVPANAAGKWQLQTRLPQGAKDYEFQLEQRFQMLTGGARVQGGILPAFEARVDGERISFVLVEDDQAYRYEGRIENGLMQGTVRWGYGPRQAEAAWHATRVFRERG